MTFTVDFTSIGPILGYFGAGVLFCIIFVKFVSSVRNKRKRREATLVAKKNEIISSLKDKLDLADAEIDHIKGVNKASGSIKLNGVRSKIVIEAEKKPWLWAYLGYQSQHSFSLAVTNKSKFQPKVFRLRPKDRRLH
jgi:hypothetical protein